jgi:translation initiation factor 2 beta subunit (eIF-2beta)/eIF-5
MEKRLVPPIVDRYGTTKTMWHNFNDICLTLNRMHEHVLLFYTVELGSECNLDSARKLIILGKFNIHKITSILKTYIVRYVICPACKNTDTKLERDPTSRLYSIICPRCHASTPVPPIKAGFVAVRKGERKAERKN